MSRWPRARDEILAQLRGTPEIRGRVLCEAYTREVDRWVLQALEEALAASPPREGVTVLPPGWALMALGGYGRRQMCLRSDVDLQVVRPDGEAVPEGFMEALLAPLMAEQLRLGHGIRTVTESRALAEEDVAFATASMDARHLAGDPTVTETIRTPIFRRLVGDDLCAMVDFLVEERQRRAERLGDTVFVLEPELKHGMGGLRDAQLLGWLARLRGQTVERPIWDAYDLLLKVRMAFHALTRFKGDRLTFEYQDRVAQLLGLSGGDTDDEGPAVTLIREVHLASRKLASQVERSLSTARLALNPGRAQPLPERPDFVIVGDRLARADGALAITTAEVEDILSAVAETDRALSPQLEDGLADFADRGGDAPMTELQGCLSALLVDPRPGAMRALRLMLRTGLLTGVIPEIEPIIGRVQRDLYHVYTVDEHTMRVLARLKAVARGEEDALTVPLTPDERSLACALPVALAALLHDIGKGYGPGHHQRGAELGETICGRLGLDPPDTRLVTGLIRHQADMALTCMRRDLSDPLPIRALARLTGDSRRLTCLYLLTVADWSNVGPAAFTSWHRSLLGDLYGRTQGLLEDPGLFADLDGVVEAHRAELLTRVLGAVPEVPDQTSRPIDDFCASMPTRYFQTELEETVTSDFELWRRAADATPIIDVRPATSRRGDADPGHVAVTVVAEDRVGLLADLSSGLATTGFSVLSADIYSLVGGQALDRFVLSDPHGTLTRPGARDRLLSAMREALTDPEATIRRVDERARAYPASPLPPVHTEVSTTNDEATIHTVFDIVSGDRTGLLRDIARFFADEGLSVELARVTTEGRVARDSFYVVDGSGAKLNPDDALAVAARLSAHVAAVGPRRTHASP